MDEKHSLIGLFDLRKYEEYADIFAMRAIFQFLKEPFWLDLLFHKAHPNIDHDLNGHFTEIFLIILANASSEYTNLVSEYLISIEAQLNSIRNTYNNTPWEQNG